MIIAQASGLCPLNCKNVGGNRITYAQNVARAKPYVTGGLVGLLAAPIIAFSAGWVSTSGARADAVENARVETLAGVCSNTVIRSFASRNLDLATLKGWGNRIARDDIVAKTMTGIEVPDLLASRITAECSKVLA